MTLDPGDEEYPPPAVEVDSPELGSPDPEQEDHEQPEPPPGAQTEVLDPREGDLRDEPTRAPKVGKLLTPATPMLKAGLPFRTSAVALDGLRCGPFRLAAGSLAGMRHLADGNPRQDVYDFIATAGGRLIVSVADGMGSRDHSQIGARLFGEQVNLLANEAGDASVEEYLVRAAANTAIQAKDWYGVASADISFVAAVAVFEGGTCSVARVGDVSAFARSDEDEFAELFAADGDNINVVSAWLPSSAVPQVVRTESDRVVIATDGLAGDLRLSPTVRQWLAQAWAEPITAAAMHEALRFRRQGSHDDRTAAVVWR